MCASGVCYLTHTHTHTRTHTRAFPFFASALSLSYSCFLVFLPLYIPPSLSLKGTSREECRLVCHLRRARLQQVSLCSLYLSLSPISPVSLFDSLELFISMCLSACLLFFFLLHISSSFSYTLAYKHNSKCHFQSIKWHPCAEDEPWLGIDVAISSLLLTHFSIPIFFFSNQSHTSLPLSSYMFTSLTLSLPYLITPFDFAYDVYAYVPVSVYAYIGFYFHENPTRLFDTLNDIIVRVILLTSYHNTLLPLCFSFCDICTSFFFLSHKLTHIRIHTHTHTYTYTYSYTHIHIHIHTYAYTHIHTHTHTHTHIHTYTYTHTLTYTHTHVHIQLYYEVKRAELGCALTVSNLEFPPDQGLPISVYVYRSPDLCMSLSLC